MLIILTGRTAAGKDTIAQQILNEYPRIKKIVTSTSRKPRKDEQDRVSYNFLSRKEFEEKLKKGEFIESVEYGGNLYGTEKAQLANASEQDSIWRIDPSRAGKVKELNLPLKAVVIYITTSADVVRKRLQERGLTDEEIEARIKRDLEDWNTYKDKYTYTIENIPGKLDQTVKKVTDIISLH